MLECSACSGCVENHVPLPLVQDALLAPGEPMRGRSLEFVRSNASNDIVYLASKAHTPKEGVALASVQLGVDMCAKNPQDSTLLPPACLRPPQVIASDVLPIPSARR